MLEDGVVRIVPGYNCWEQQSADGHSIMGIDLLSVALKEGRGDECLMMCAQSKAIQSIIEHSTTERRYGDVL